MDAGLLAIGNRFSAADPKGVLLDLDFQVVLVNTWQFNNCDEIVTLLEYVDWWKAAFGRSPPEAILFFVAQ